MMYYGRTIVPFPNPVLANLASLNCWCQNKHWYAEWPGRWKHPPRPWCLKVVSGNWPSRLFRLADESPEAGGK